MNYIKKLSIRGFKKFEKIDIEFNKDQNIIVGENESGKSTILEAINIALNQMYKNVDKYIIKDILNSNLKQKFIENPSIKTLPAVKIELRFNLEDYQDKFIYYGENNLNGSKDTDYGILFECKFDDEFDDLLKEEINKGEIPYEYYIMTWTTFQGSPYKILKKPIRIITIDTSTSDSSNSFNYFNRTLFNSRYTEEEKMKAKNIFRHDIENVFNNIDLEQIDNNRRFGVNSKKLVFESIISVFESDIPLENKGSGMENLIKTQIAINKPTSKLDVVMLEEPENHLCPSNLKKMLSIIEKNTEQCQLIITTHNNLIASRLNLNNVLWICNSNASRLNNVKNDIAKFFQKADNNNFLQLLLSHKVILVEGASEYLLLPKMYENIKGNTIDEDKICIISCNGISYKNYLEIAYKTNKKVAVITDNDEKTNNLENMNKFNAEHTYQRIFMDKDINNWTFETCLYNLNKPIFDNNIPVQDNSEYKFKDKNYGQVLGKMLNNKVEIAYKILTENYDIKIPQYIKDAIEWVSK